MTRKIKKGIAVFLTVIMVLSMWTVPVYAEGTVGVVFTGVNVTVKSGATGSDAASFGEDYTITLEITENYQVYEMEVSGYGISEGSNFNYTFDADTGVLTIPKEEIDGYGEGLQVIYIDVFAAREYNADTDLKKIESIPFSDEYVILEENNIGIGMDDGVMTGSMKLYEVDLTEGQALMYTAIGTDTIDTDLMVYLAKKTEQENMFAKLDRVDSDNVGFGEKGFFEAPETGTYVFIVVPYDYYFGDGVKFELEEAPELNETLNFMQETAPTPDADDLWAWDADTKTLTLKDGFEITTISCAIIVPNDTTINVEGKVSVESISEDAICTNGNLNINLKEGSELNLEAGYVSIFSTGGEINIIGEPDEEGNLPVINSVANSGNILIEDDGHYELLYENLNEVVMKNVNANFESYSECIYVGNNSSEEEVGSVVIEDSIIDFTAEDETIQIYTGDIIIRECDSKIHSNGEEGLDSDMGVEIIGGRMVISAIENAIDTAEKLTITDADFMFTFINEDGMYDILMANEISIDGEFVVYDLDMNILYEGEMTDEIKNMFVEENSFCFRNEEGTFIYPKVVVSKFNGDAENNVVEGVLEEYEAGEKLEFTTSSEGIDEELPVWNYTRFKARTWEILDTDLSGIVEEEGNSVDISSLEEGTYTLKVRFEQQVCQRNYWSFYTNATDDKIDYVEVEFTVLGEEEETTPPPAEDDEEDVTPPPAEDDEEDVTPPPAEDDEEDVTPPPAEDDEEDVTPPPAEDDEEEVTPPPAEDDNSANTGNNSKAGFVAIVMLTAAMIVFGAVKSKKRA